MDYEVEGVRPSSRPNKTWSKVTEKKTVKPDPYAWKML